MSNQHQNFFIPKKALYKIIIFICTISFCLLGVYFFTYIYLKNEIKNLVSNQQAFFKTQNLTFQFKSISSPWKLWPQITLVYPSIQKNTLTISPQTLWQAKQATLSYSLWPPFSLSVQLDGEQLFCLNSNLEKCFQIHGDPWDIQISQIGKYEKKTLFLQAKNIFYTSNSKAFWGVHSLQLKNVKVNLHLNPLAKQKSSLVFSTINIKQALVNFIELRTQNLNKIQIQTALIQEDNTQDQSYNLYKLLLQKVDFSWNALSIYSSGKIYFAYPQLLPTGDISLHLNGIDQAIYQQLALLNCCNKLKGELSQITLPSQLNFTLLIRKGVFYLGAIPLQTIWYNHLKNFIHTYTK